MVAVGELLASAALKTVFGKLTNLAFNITWKEIARQLNFSKDLKSIEDNLSFIELFLKDAERQASRLKSVRHTLKKLKAAAYDLEDMLLLFESTTNHKATKELVACFERLKMPHKVKRMKETIDEIIGHQNKFNFIQHPSLDDEGVIHNNRRTTSFNNEVTVGRIDEKERIISWLLTDGETLTVPIYGIGGVGKTTLAQMVYNDDRTKDFFDVQAWVYVSENFDLISIGTSIISQLDNSSSSNINNGSDLESVLKNLSAIINNKRFLLVLDDIWEEGPLQLEKIKLLLGSKKGSKIVVTTRLEKIARHLNKIWAINLGVLSNDHCWELFRAKALPPGTVDYHRETVGRAIVEKCKGIPLAVKSLGYLCRNSNQWEAIRDSDIWGEDRDDGPFKDTQMLPSLKLSYHYMPCYLKSCFAYCSIFPKGCHIEKSSLIQQWIALGFVQLTDGSFTAQQAGERYFEELLEMSFLQDVAGMSPTLFTRYNNPHGVLFQMHDLVHELARLVAGEEIISFDANRQQNLTGKTDNCRYMLLSNLCSSSPYLPSTARALHFNKCSIDQTSLKSLMGAEFLRVLDLSACTTIAKLPDSIINLRLLKFLNISGMQTGLLPRSLSSLHGLQALNLSENTCLVQLPNYICELVNLQYLDLHGCSNLKELPKDIHKLKELVHLNLSGCSSLQLLPGMFGELLKLAFLDLSYCSQIQMLPSEFGGLQKLSFLNLSHCCRLQKLPDSFSSLETLIHLNMSCCCQLSLLPRGLHMNKLVALHLSGCTSLWNLPEISARYAGCLNLEILDLSGCTNLSAIPTSYATRLCQLRYLNLSGCSQISNIPSLVSSWKFGNLEYLNLSGVSAKDDFRAPGTSATNVMSRVVSRRVSSELQLGMIVEDIITQRLVHLKYLSIGGFTLFSEQGIASLVDFLTLPDFDVRTQPGDNHSNIMLLHQILDVTQHQLNIKCLENVVSPEEAKQVELGRKQQVRFLSFEWSSSDTGTSVEDERRAKATAVLEDLRPHHNLRWLSLKGYSGSTFPDWINNINDTLPNLVKIVLSDLKGCDYIPTLGHLPNLLELEINNMPLLHHVRLVPCKKLRQLTLVKLQANATVVIFHDNTHKQANEVELIRDRDEEESQTDKLPGSLAVKKQVKQKDTAVALLKKLKGCLKTPCCGISRETKRAKDIGPGPGNDSPAFIPEITPGPSHERREQAAIPTLGYFKIESCQKLQLCPYIPVCEEYFIKDSSFDMAHSSFDMAHTGFGTLRKLKITYCHSDMEPLTQLLFLFTSLQELELYGFNAFNNKLLSTLKVSTLEKLAIPSLPGAEMNKCISELSHIPYVTTRQVALFSVRSKQGCMGSDPSYSQQPHWKEKEAHQEQQPLHFATGSATSCSTKISNFSLLYQYHDDEIGQLIIQNLEHVETAEEVNEHGNLSQYGELQSLSLMWSSSNLSHGSTINDSVVLEKLQPHEALKTLQIQGYRGQTFCSWVMNMSFFLPNLVKVELSDMLWCEHIPLLGQLANLEVLCISNMPRVRKLGGDIYMAERPFMKLRELKLSSMGNLEEWTTRLSDGHEIFPNLKFLALINSPRLRFVPAYPRSQRCQCNIDGSGKLVSSKNIGYSYSSLSLEIKDNGFPPNIPELLQDAVNLEELSIRSCINLVILPDTIRSCRYLRKLEILECHNFSALPEWLGELTLLEELTVRGANLEQPSTQSCTCLVIVPDSIRRCRNLRKLEIVECQNFSVLLESLGELTSLRQLTVRADNLEPSKQSIQYPTALQMLVLNKCSFRILERSGGHVVNLLIEHLHHVHTTEEAENFDLTWKKNLCSPNEYVLEKMLPRNSLKIPHWMSSLTNLVRLELYSLRVELLHLMSSLTNLVKLQLTNVGIVHLHLDQLQSLSELHISRLHSIGPKFFIWCNEPLRNLRTITMFELTIQELQISVEGQGNDENLFPNLQDFEVYHCSRLRFEPSIPRSARYILSGSKRRPGEHICPSFQRIMGPSVPAPLSQMKIKHGKSLSSASWEGLGHFEIGQLIIDGCSDEIPLPESIHGWRSLQRLEILNCENIATLPEWLGEITSLQELKVEAYSMQTLPACVQQLTRLETLTLSKCGEILEKRCKFGEDRNNLAHIPNVRIESGHRVG